MCHDENIFIKIPATEVLKGMDIHEKAVSLISEKNEISKRSKMSIQGDIKKNCACKYAGRAHRYEP